MSACSERPQASSSERISKFCLISRVSAPLKVMPDQSTFSAAAFTPVGAWPMISAQQLSSDLR